MMKAGLKWFLRTSLATVTFSMLCMIQRKWGGEYSQTVLKQEESFDVIVVDGRDRVNCVKNSMKALSQNGIIILDDSSRDKYKEAFDFMLSNGFKQITFCGLKSTGRKEDCTTIFYRRNNCFDI